MSDMDPNQMFNFVTGNTDGLTPEQLEYIEEYKRLLETEVHEIFNRVREERDEKG